MKVYFLTVCTCILHPLNAVFIIIINVFENSITIMMKSGLKKCTMLDEGGSDGVSGCTYISHSMP